MKMKRLILAVPVILLALLACNLSSQSPAVATGAQTLTALAEYAAPNSTPQSDTTPGPISTGQPAVHVNQLTPCRTGPSTAYDSVDALPAGFEAAAVGIDAAEDYLLIKLATGQHCWLAAQAATLNGNASALPEVSPPPTPTPHAPAAPQNLTGQISYCSNITASGSSGFTRYSIQLYWTDMADNETNYFVKAGGVVSQLPADASSFGIANRDVPPAGESLTVQVIARNAAGENSVSKTFTCP